MSKETITRYTCDHCQFRWVDEQDLDEYTYPVDELSSKILELIEGVKGIEHLCTDCAQEGKYVKLDLNDKGKLSFPGIKDILTNIIWDCVPEKS